MTKRCYYSHSIDEAISCWKDSGLVAIPTETVYGLAAPIDDGLLLKKIFSYKERPFYDPLIIHVSDLDMAHAYAHWDPVSIKLAKAFWPGPLTLILPKKQNVDDLITSSLESVGIRCPRNDLTLSLIKRAGVPLAAPSANKFTKTSATKAEHVYESFKDQHLCILKGEHEAGEVGIESTIVRVEDKKVTILRPGMVTSDHLKNALSDLADLDIGFGQTAVEETMSARQAPGQELVHYRPDYQLYLHKEEEGALKKEALSPLEVIVLDQDPVVCAREIYAKLKKPLPKGVEGRLFVLPKNRLSLNLSEREQWQSIINRLNKAGQWL